ncbi:MAG: hypothetical protein OEV42_07975 [Deltaproteobacteria bacterium]|nr:hypothetical protein [Deltaproteobacteria bacterium]
MFGIGMPEVIILTIVFLFIWFSIKIAKYSFRQMNKVENQSLGSESERGDHQLNIDINDFRFIADNLISEKEVILTEEEIPLDNSHGSSPIVSEHEFTRTVINSFRLDKVQTMSGLVKSSLWTLVETEVKKNLTKSIGIQIGEQITRRVKVRIEAGPGQVVRYKLIWKQKQREGKALVNIQNKEIQIPYTTMYGLFHSVKSIEV